MPSDIRSFFGGASSQKDQKLTVSQEEPAPSKKRGRPSRRVIDDSEEEATNAGTKESPAKRVSPRTLKKRAPSPKGEMTTTSDYFGSKNKPKRSEAPKPKVDRENGSAKPAPETAPKASRSKAAKSSEDVQGAKESPKARPSRSKTVAKSYIPVEDEDEDFQDDLNNEDDVFRSNYKSGGKGRQNDDYKESEASGSDVKSQPVGRVNGKGRQPTPAKDDEQTSTGKVSGSVKKPAAGVRKRKSSEVDEDHDGGSPKITKKRGRPANKASPPKKKAKREDVPENAEVQAIFDSIPTIRPPTPPDNSGEPKKFDFRAHQAHKGPAPAAGSKEIPVGADNCLAGLTFVFTGLLDSISRDEGQALVKRYGGKVTTGPSKNTSYVVLGSDAGPRKLEIIQKNNIKTVNEDGLFELIRRLPANGGGSKAAAKFEEKKQAQAEKVQKMAAEMEKEEKMSAASNGITKRQGIGSTKDAPQPAVDTRLWTVKYAPTQISQICGNKGQVEKLQRWLRNFPKSQRTRFKLAGPDGSGIFRAVIIYGPPGIGKTTAAHLVAKMEGYDIVESNASDTRSKKLVETGLRGVLSTTSLMGYFSGDSQKLDPSKKKLVLIMDEVDGMSAGDRGGVGALAAVCKKTQIPIILICNDRKLPKMKPFDFVTYDMPFRRPTAENIRSRIMTIAYREGIKLPANVIDALIEGSGADIRQVVNMISTAKLDQESMDFDKGKEMSKAWEKHIILKPWDITSKILGGGLFAESSKSTLNDKIELYFNDHEFSYLMLQENYLGTSPIRLGRLSGKDRNLKLLELVDKAASSISDGDLVDRMIHGSQQHWSLMPTHAVFSFVRPASFVAGSMAGHRTQFTSWLGKNSTLGKNTRTIKEIQGHMRLRTSGDRHEVRLQYVPLLWKRLVEPLQQAGKDAVPNIIALMDDYFLTKDDFDAIMELGVGSMTSDGFKIESSTKAAFTRAYNAQSHPLPFMKASNVLAPKKSTKERPDLEEAIEESDEGELLDDNQEDEEDVDISKDKYVKQPKKKPAPKNAAASKAASSGKKKPAGRPKKRGRSEDGNSEEDESAEDAKTTKRRGGTKGKAAAKKRV